jgi:hypothetical protein
MRKLISFSFTALLLLVGAFFLFSRISTSAAGEPYEVQQARVASQVADYQRQTQDSAFRSAVVNVTMLLVVLLIIALVITGLLIVLKVVGHWLEVDRWRQEKERDTFAADRLGNYPAVILDNTLHQLTPGNSPVPLPADNIIVGNSPMARIPATRYNVPMLINTGGQRLAMPSRPEFTVIQPEQLEGPDERTFEAVNDSSDSNVLEFSEILAQCKAAGEGKQASIEAFTGIKKGGSRAWKIYSDYWDSLK